VFIRITIRFAALLVFLAGAVVYCEDTSLGKRTPFEIPLVKLKLAFDESTKQLQQVQIDIDGQNEYAIIARGQDYHIKNTHLGTERTAYSESPDRSFMLSDFEAKQINRVVRSLVETLDIFERDLKRGRWYRCLYLDSYFPRFLKAYYYLICAARNSPYALPRIARVPDAAYDVSENSPKSDARIKMWQTEKDYVIKLRIISKELAFQLKIWQQKELDNPKRNPEIAYSAKAEEAYGLFVKLYFNLKPTTEVPDFGDHL
jgi:hypothetical protein